MHLVLPAHAIREMAAILYVKTLVEILRTRSTSEILPVGYATVKSLPFHSSSHLLTMVK
jgi:hypothetical protein